MRRHAACGCRRLCIAAGARKRAAPLMLLLALTLSLFGVTTPGVARQADPGYAPASGPAQVIAQGVDALPAGDVVWRTVRTRG
jgi:hypothetical protein